MKVEKYNDWDEQPNINLAMKYVLYTYNPLFTFCLISYITFVQ